MPRKTIQKKSRKEELSSLNGGLYSVNLEVEQATRDLDKHFHRISKSPVVQKTLAVALMLFVLVATLILFKGGEMTGWLVSTEQLTIHTQEADMNLTGTGDETITLNDLPESFNLRSLKLNGHVHGEGTFEVYLVDSSGERYLLMKEDETELLSRITMHAVNPPGQDTDKKKYQGDRPEERSITTSLEYATGSIWDADDDGVVYIEEGVIDLTVSGSTFNWAVDESRLCTAWTVRSLDEYVDTTLCHGATDCCALSDVAPEEDDWDAELYLFHGKYGTTDNNTVTAQVVFLNQSIGEETYLESVVGSTAALPAVFIEKPLFEFRDACVDTCSLPAGLNSTGYTIEFHLSRGVAFHILNMTYVIEDLSPKHIVAEDNGTVEINPEVEDSEGNVLAADIEFMDENDDVVSRKEMAARKARGIGAGLLGRDDNKLSISKGKYKVRLEFTDEDSPVESIEIKDVEIDGDEDEFINVDDVPETGEFSDYVEVYAIDPTAVNFTMATVSVTATGDTLYKCKEWDFAAQSCNGEWLLFKTGLVPGKTYTFTLTPDDPAFAETLQPNASEGMDAFVNQNAPAQNYGNLSFIVGAESGGNYVAALLKFNRSNIPGYADITSATLKLYFYDSPTNPSNAINLSTRMITSDWGESTVMWSTRPSYSGIYSDIVTLTDNYGWIEWDVTDGVQRWFNGSNPNYGIALVPDLVTASTDKRFYSSDHTNASLRPILDVNYTTEETNVTLIWPLNDTQHGDGDIYVGYEVSSEGDIAGCGLIYNGTVYDTDGSITEGALQRFKVTLNQDKDFLWSVNCTTSSGSMTTSEERLVHANTSKADFYGWVENYAGNRVNVTVDFVQDETIMFTSTGKVHALVIDDGLYNITVSPVNNSRIQDVTFVNINITKSLTKIVDLDHPPAGIWNKQFAVNPIVGNSSDNEMFTVSSIAGASSNIVYKCFDWNFTTQTCYGNWTAVQMITPGQAYTMILNLTDPGFGEGNVTSNLTAAEHSGSDVLAQVIVKDDTYYSADMKDASKALYLNFSLNLTDGTTLHIFARQNSGVTVGIYAQSDTLGTNPLGNFTVTSPTGEWYNVTLNMSTPTDGIWFGEGNGSGTDPGEEFDVVYAGITDTIPPGTVADLVDQSSGADWIYWNWTPPNVTDFSQAIVYINGSNVANTSDDHYNATGLAQYTDYMITVHTKDTSSNVNDTDVNSTAKTRDGIPPEYSSIIDDNDTMYLAGQDYMFNITWTDNVGVSAVTFEFDGTNHTNASNDGDEYHLTLTDLSAGSHSYTWYAQDAEGNSNDTGTRTVTINRIASAVNLLLDGTDGDIIIERTSSANLTGSRLTGEGNIELYRNGSLIASGSPVLTDVSAYNVEALYNITAVYPQSQNYSTSSETHWLTVDDTTPPGIVTGLVVLSKDNDSIFWAWNDPADADFAYTEVWLNGTNVQNTSGESYSATGLQQFTHYTISLRTVDDWGTVSTEWVNDTEQTDAACTENWMTNYTACVLNDTQVKYYTDTNSCGTTFTLPGDNGTIGSCDCVAQTDFNGSTTDLTGNDLTDMQGVILEVWPYATVEFLENITISSCIDIDSNAGIGPGYVSIDTTQLPELNRSANITMYSINLTVPQILLDGAECPSDICTEVNYSGGTYKFNVTHFTNYSVREGPYCGDSSCNGGESCSSCALDCGTCVAPGGGGGGGGGGGSSAPRSTVCEPEWLCYSWGPCTSNQQSRACFDANACNNETGMPATTQFCVEGCAERWACADWGACTEAGVQTRTCNDRANCGTDKRKPETVTPCEYGFCSDGKKNNDEAGVDCGGSCRECTPEEEKAAEDAKRNLLTGEAITVQPYEPMNPVYILPLLLLIALLIAVVALHKSKKICGKAKHILTAVHVILILAITILALLTFDADQITGEAVAEVVADVGIREMFILLLSSSLIIGAITYVTLHKGSHICELDPDRINPFTRVKDTLANIGSCIFKSRDDRYRPEITHSKKGLDEFKRSVQSSWSYIFEKNKRDRKEIREIAKDPLNQMKRLKKENVSRPIERTRPEKVKKDIAGVERFKTILLRRMNKTCPSTPPALTRSPKKKDSTDIKDINDKIAEIRKRINKIQR